MIKIDYAPSIATFIQLKVLQHIEIVKAVQKIFPPPPWQPFLCMLVFLYSPLTKLLRRVKYVEECRQEKQRTQPKTKDSRVLTKIVRVDSYLELKKISIQKIIC